MKENYKPDCMDDRKSKIRRMFERISGLEKPKLFGKDLGYLGFLVFKVFKKLFFFGGGG